jgi:chorismate synthase
MDLSEADIQPELDRRKPGTSRHVTQRQEPDTVEIFPVFIRVKPPERRLHC